MQAEHERSILGSLIAQISTMSSEDRRVLECHLAVLRLSREQREIVAEDGSMEGLRRYYEGHDCSRDEALAQALAERAESMMQGAGTSRDEIDEVRAAAETIVMSLEGVYSL